MSGEKHKLKEGEEYSFVIEKTITIPGDDEYHVLTDPFGKKHLLPAGFYKHYGLQPGQDLICRVDKIDCNGKIYLEPRHPHYKQGSHYQFPVLRIEERLNSIGRPENVAVVKDIYDNELVAPCPPEWIEQGNKRTIRCRIERIKKGSIHLTIVQRGRKAGNLTIGKRYAFEVKELAKGLDNNEYIVLEDPNEQKHLLRYDYYADYNISVGETIMGTVVKLSTDGRLLIEPDHPYLKIGEKYPFIIVGKVYGKEAGYIEETYILVKDYMGKHYTVHVDPDKGKTYKKGDTVFCRIEKMKKGMPVLNLTGEKLNSL